MSNAMEHVLPITTFVDLNADPILLKITIRIVMENAKVLIIHVMESVQVVESTAHHFLVTFLKIMNIFMRITFGNTVTQKTFTGIAIILVFAQMNNVVEIALWGGQDVETILVFVIIQMFRDAATSTLTTTENVMAIVLGHMNNVKVNAQGIVQHVEMTFAFVIAQTLAVVIACLDLSTTSITTETAMKIVSDHLSNVMETAQKIEYHAEIVLAFVMEMVVVVMGGIGSTPIASENVMKHVLKSWPLAMENVYQIIHTAFMFILILILYLILLASEMTYTRSTTNHVEKKVNVLTILNHVHFQILPLHILHCNSRQL